jgi:hypothetical protein
LKALVSGVRIARVITTSSAFLDVLTKSVSGARIMLTGVLYIEDNPDEPGVMCLRMELSLSPAIRKRIGKVVQSWW